MSDQPVARPGERNWGRATAQASETVLLVEDEEQVRMVAQRALVGAGYTVVSAGDATEALAWCRAHDKKFDLVLTDVVMPGMDGPALVELLGSLRPDFKVLYMSGYIAGVFAQRRIDVRAEELLQKPFTPAQLLQRVRAVLDAGTENTNAAVRSTAAS